MSEDVELKSLARATAGFSGADLANLLNEGALIADAEESSAVERIDLDDARENSLRERRRVMDDEDRKIIAYHEGHAIVQAKIDDLASSYSQSYYHSQRTESRKHNVYS